MIDEETRSEILDAAAHADFCLAAAVDGRFEGRHGLRDAAEALIDEANVAIGGTRIRTCPECLAAGHKARRRRP